MRFPLPRRPREGVRCVSWDKLKRGQRPGPDPLGPGPGLGARSTLLATFYKARNRGASFGAWAIRP